MANITSTFISPALLWGCSWLLSTFPSSVSGSLPVHFCSITSGCWPWLNCVRSHSKLSPYPAAWVLELCAGSTRRNVGVPARRGSKWGPPAPLGAHTPSLSLSLNDQPHFISARVELLIGHKMIVLDWLVGCSEGLWFLGWWRLGDVSDVLFSSLDFGSPNCLP